MEKFDNPTNTPSQMVLMTFEDFKRMLQESVDATLQKERAYESIPEVHEDDDIEDYLSREEVAEKLGVNLSTLWRWNRDGYLPCVKIGSKVKYPMSIIRAFIDRNRGRFEK